jgi:hypothetical protein
MIWEYTSQNGRLTQHKKFLPNSTHQNFCLDVSVWSVIYPVIYPDISPAQSPDILPLIILDKIPAGFFII